MFCALPELFLGLHVADFGRRDQLRHLRDLPRTSDSIRSLERQISRASSPRQFLARGRPERSRPGIRAEKSLDRAFSMNGDSGKPAARPTIIELPTARRSQTVLHTGPASESRSRDRRLYPSRTASAAGRRGQAGPQGGGVMLITAGIVQVDLPGPGIPAIIAGGLALWPEALVT